MNGVENLLAVSFNFSKALWFFMYFLNFIAIIIVVFVERRNQTSTLLWTIVLVVLPVFGLFFYIFLGKGPSFGRRKKFLNKFYTDSTYYEEMQSQLEALNRNEEHIDPHAIQLIRHNMNFEGNLCTRYNDVKIYTDINEQYDDMIADIECAEKFVHVLYYIIKPDKSGDRLRKALTAKAKQGIKVRLVYDDLGCRRLGNDYFDALIRAGGEVARFFPSAIRLLNLNLNYRNHRKIVVVDNRVGYMGGANIGDEYIGKDKELFPWRDTHIKISGEAVFILNVRFMEDFNFAYGSDYVPEAYSTGCLTGKPFVPMQLVSDGPDTVEGIIESCYIKAIYSATKRVFIQTPYLIPDEVFLEALKASARSGVDVRIMIPKLPDKMFVYYCTMSYAAELVRAGCKVFLREGFLHSKTLLVDDNISSIGSFNIDIRSFKLNFELTAFIYDKDTGNKMLQIYEEDIAKSIEYTIEDINKRSLWRRFKERLMRLSSPIF